MSIFSSLSFKRKVLWIIYANVIFALILAAIGFVTADVLQFRRAMPRDLNIVARIIADNARSPLEFRDPRFAEETLLASLSANPRITQAAIYDGMGEIFAEYVREGGGYAAPDSPEPGGHFFANGHLGVFQEVVFDGLHLGTVYVQSDMQDLYDRLLTYSLVALGVMLIASGGASAMGIWLQRFVAKPVESLAATAQDVVERTDYTVRADRYASDELGTLTDSFNSMLAHIQSQAAELADSRRKAEAIIDSINGIVWECDPRDIQFTYVSRQSEILLGYTPAEWTEQESFWQELLHPEDAEYAISKCHEFITRGKPYQYDYRMIAADGCVVWIRESGSIMTSGDGHKVVRGIFLDITEQKKAEEELAVLNKELAESNRQAGIAEMATGVLHNVGNVLNTVNLTVNEVQERLTYARLDHLRRAVDLLNEQNGNTAQFLQSDPRGKELPRFLSRITGHLEDENRVLQSEAGKLVGHIEHIKDIVATQQSFARAGGVIERVSPEELIEAAIKLTLGSFTKHEIEIVITGADLPQVPVDRHKIIQILVNLLSNAKDSIKQAETTDRRVLVEVSGVDDLEVVISVTDFGVGIEPEIMERIFQHGFTTKPNGHGFGLHSSSLTAQEMGYSLSAKSDGLGKGATFTLKMPTGCD